jgi:hypothetical protein
MHGMRLAVVTLAVALAACGGEDSAAEDFGAQVVEALCAREARCGVDSRAETCEASWRSRDGATWLGLGTRYDAALESGQLRFDEAAARRCVDAIRNRDCRLPALSQAALSRGIEYEPSCQLLRVQRTVESCVAHAECGEDGYCGYTGSSGCQGTCVARAGEGASAEWPEHCAPGLVLTEGASSCERPRDEGETCFVTLDSGGHEYPCAPGLWCERGSDVCRRTGGEGDACSFEQDLRCGDAFVCLGGRCQRRPSVGSTCTAPRVHDSHSGNPCQRDLFCDADAQQPGTCQARRKKGDACRHSFECAADQHCAGSVPESGTWGRCQQRPGRGEACELYYGGGPVTNCLAGHDCSPQTQRCVPLVHEGEPCGRDARCALGVCSSEGRCTSPEALTCR